MAWMLLWRAMLAENKQSAATRKADASFYQGQVKSAEFFIRSVLPVTFGRMDSILDTCGAAVEISDESFGGTVGLQWGGLLTAPLSGRRKPFSDEWITGQSGRQPQ